MENPDAITITLSIRSINDSGYQIYFHKFAYNVPYEHADSCDWTAGRYEMEISNYYKTFKNIVYTFRV